MCTAGERGEWRYHSSLVFLPGESLAAQRTRWLSLLREGLRLNNREETTGGQSMLSSFNNFPKRKEMVAGGKDCDKECFKIEHTMLCCHTYGKIQ